MATNPEPCAVLNPTFGQHLADSKASAPAVVVTVSMSLECGDGRKQFAAGGTLAAIVTA
jgi:hypothetical protein